MQFPMFSFLARLLGDPKSNLYGSAHFLGRRAKSKVLSSSNDGLVIDGVKRVSFERSCQHVAIEGKTGSGKTAGYIIPNLLNLSGNSSAVVTDYNGKIYAKTAAYLASIGYAIKIVNFSQFSHSLHFNPLARASTFAEIMQVSDAIIDTAYPTASGDQVFWNNGAKTIINILIRYLQSRPAKERNLYSVLHLLDMFGENQTTIDDMMRAGLDNPTFAKYLSFFNDNEKTISGMLSSAKMALVALNDPDIAHFTSFDTLNFESLRDQDTALFIIVNATDVKYYNFILTLLYSQIFSFCSQAPKPKSKDNPIYFLLDEAGNMGKIPALATSITTLRDRKCPISLLFQDKRQLVQQYGEQDALTIYNGCRTQIYFSGLGLETCKYISETLGKTTITHREQGYSKTLDDSANRDKETGRDLMTVDEIRCMGDNEIIVIISNLRPMKLKIKLYFQNRGLMKKTCPHPLFK